MTAEARARLEAARTLIGHVLDGDAAFSPMMHAGIVLLLTKALDESTLTDQDTNAR